MADLIDSLCMTWRHDYGLHKADDDDSISSGMTTAERESLRRKMTQIHAHHIAPLEERIRDLEHDKADWLKANAPGGWIDDLRRASQPGSGEDDTARLDFMIEQQCWIQWTNRDGSILQCQVYTQDEDEEYHVHPSEDRYFNTPREALDAARASLDGPREG